MADLNSNSIFNCTSHLLLLKSLNCHSLFSTLKGPEIAVENILLGLLARTSLENDSFKNL